MKKFMDGDFLLDNDCAKRLFHKYAEDMPICDYHCHLSPGEIYENKKPESITALWLYGDHYKWRAMRSCGIDERLCTGDADDREKFRAFAKALQYCIGNPLYHWAHLELQRYFGIYTPLNEKTADEIYDRANERIRNGGFAPRDLISKSKVRFLCTTDDPVDDLRYHGLLAQDASFDCRVLPGFRPDKALSPEADGFSNYIKQLGDAAETNITDFSSLLSALGKRLEYFNKNGCRVADHSFGRACFRLADKNRLDDIFSRALNGGKPTPEECEEYKTAVMLYLGREYSRLDWTMEIHIGALRNNNTLMFEKIGADAGFDSVDDGEVARPLSAFLDALCRKGCLPRTVLFNLNDKDNTVIGTMPGNFQDSQAQSKIQYGPAWWFLDTKDGMTAQLKALGNLGALGKFIGMETDSRSFTSYTRHEYFRRILCALIGEWVENGMYAFDEDILKEIIEGICYNNAVKYFGFNK